MRKAFAVREPTHRGRCPYEDRACVGVPFSIFQWLDEAERL